MNITNTWVEYTVVVRDTGISWDHERTGKRFVPEYVSFSPGEITSQVVTEIETTVRGELYNATGTVFDKSRMLMPTQNVLVPDGEGDYTTKRVWTVPQDEYVALVRAAAESVGLIFELEEVFE